MAVCAASLTDPWDSWAVAMSSKRMTAFFRSGWVSRARTAEAVSDAVGAALEGTDVLFAERREGARQRQAVIAANAELRERELIKLASLASALAGALRRRGVAEPAASLAAEAGIAVFRLAFERWVNDASQAGLPQFIRESLGELKAMTAGNDQRGRLGSDPACPAARRAEPRRVGQRWRRPDGGKGWTTTVAAC